MEIVRKIKKDDISIMVKTELTDNELYLAYKEYVTGWMSKTCKELLVDYFEDEKQLDNLCKELGETAYDKYADAQGTDYECCVCAVDDYLVKHPELTGDIEEED